ncbi:Pentatricopeptide repeat-containing protein [Platanthera zijinensis]|uniref:Pentatricopeptide repeat-containing protein n=1 Tax=Platanthera zijinensis TaxID=2320716 RepID=A0AAP0C039_9ASPA
MELIESMPFEANAAIWGALLGSSRVHGDVKLGIKAAEMLLVLEPEKSGTLVILANIYASAGMWSEVASMRRLMKDSMAKKEPEYLDEVGANMCFALDNHLASENTFVP